MSDAYEQRRARGLAVMRKLFGTEQAQSDMAETLTSVGALGTFALQTVAGEVWSRPQLSSRDRSLVVLAFLIPLGRVGELRTHIQGALNHGLSREEIDEIILQLCAYAGFPFAMAAAEVADLVFASADGSEHRSTPPAPAEAKDDARRRADGIDVYRTLNGLADTAAAAAAADAAMDLGEVGRLAVDFALGEVWSRPQLSRRDRSLVVISALTALCREPELAVHIKGALNHGVTREEVEEVMIQAVVYGGFPRAVEGVICARKVFAELDG